MYTAIRSRLRPMKLALQNGARTLSYKLQRAIKPPVLPSNASGKVLIHLGCGPQNDTRYINVDAVPMPHVHYVARVEKLPMFKSNFADLIYACHILEHISYQQTVNVLKEWKRVLKKGGVLRLSVPDFEKIISLYEAEGRDAARTMPPLLGTQDEKYGFHKSIFNEKYLRGLLKEAGFREVRGWDPETASYYDFNDWAGKRLVYSKYHISLNLEGIK